MTTTAQGKFVLGHFGGERPPSGRPVPLVPLRNTALRPVPRISEPDPVPRLPQPLERIVTGRLERVESTLGRLVPYYRAGAVMGTTLGGAYALGNGIKSIVNEIIPPEPGQLDKQARKRMLDHNKRVRENAKKYGIPPKRNKRETQKTPPLPRLVGVEPNPGPKGKVAKALKQMAKHVARKTDLAEYKGRLVSAMKLRQKKPYSINNHSNNAVSAPAAFANLVTHPDLKWRTAVEDGQQVLYVSGSHYMSSVVTSTTGFPSFVGGVTGTPTINQSCIALDTDGLGGYGSFIVPFTPTSSPLANLAISFAEAKFSKVKLVYAPDVSTSTSGRFAIGFTPDGAAGLSAVSVLTFANVMQLKGAVSVTSWVPCEIDITSRLQRNKWIWDNQPTTTTAADLRLANSGILLISSQTTEGAGNSTVVGDINVEWEVGLRELGPYASTLITYETMKYRAQKQLATMCDDFIFEEAAKRKQKLEEKKSEEFVITDPASACPCDLTACRLPHRNANGSSPSAILMVNQR